MGYYSFMRSNDTKETTLMNQFHPNLMIEECDRRGAVARPTGQQRFNITPRPNRHGVRIDAEAVKALCKKIGVTSNVRIAWSNGTRTYGCHRFHPLQGHRITVSTNMLRDGQQLSETLAHELQHAADCDRLGSVEFGRQYRMFSRQGYGWSARYEANPFEQAARMRGEMCKDDMRLGWRTTPFSRWNTATMQHEPVTETRPDWYKTVVSDPRNSDRFNALDDLRKAKACLASTKSLLKRAIREENWDRARNLQDKQAKDEERVRRLETFVR